MPRVSIAHAQKLVASFQGLHHISAVVHGAFQPLFQMLDSSQLASSSRQLNISRSCGDSPHRDERLCPGVFLVMNLLILLKNVNGQSCDLLNLS